MWYHVAAIYNGTKKSIELFLNGESVWFDSGLTGAVLNNTTGWNSDHDFEIGRNTELDNNYFEGDIYESRVYAKALSLEQLQQQVYHEIENNGGVVRGSVIPKNIKDLNWSDLILYYKMNAINTGFTPDESNSSIDGGLHNMRTHIERTAPLPYETTSGGDGNWSSTNNWLHGDVWDICGSHSDFTIVRIKDDLSVTTTQNTVGLIIESGAELDVKNDAGIINSWYLKLDGKIDLNGESQLVQTEFSDLDVNSSGSIEIEQQGKADVHSYNYWSAPVSLVNITANNMNHTVAGILKDGSNPLVPQNINFITYSYDGESGSPISLADFWMFKFVNSPDDYNNWTHIRSTGTLQVGEGYTQKGTGTSAFFQNYIFDGKPNNGRKADANAMPGNNSVQLPIGANNTYLVGNPFPSAIDAHKFIDDNIASIEDNGDIVGSGTTNGALYFWDHWGGESHNLHDYQGGYATLNKLGATYAIPDPGVSNVDTGDVNKALPQRYIPVGQGFFVQGDTDGGTIEFNNSQRVFQREMDGNSTFVSTAVSASSRVSSRNSSEENTDEIERVYFTFTTPEGPQRQLLLGIKEGLTEMIDYGYDAELFDDAHPSECTFVVEDKPMVIQGIGRVYNGLELPLTIRIGQDGLSTFEADSLADLDEDVNLYFLDKETGEQTSLETTNVVNLNLPVGEYTNRFYLVFERIVLDVEDELPTILDNLVVYFNATNNQIVLSNEKAFTISNISIYNMLEQRVY